MKPDIETNGGAQDASVFASKDLLGEWREIEYGGLKMRAETGLEWREATVIQGGNDLWTAYVHQQKLGRKKLKGEGRVAGKMVAAEMMKPQTKTKDEARIWAEEVWMRLPDLSA
jgi:hypothetical protein